MGYHDGNGVWNRERIMKFDESEEEWLDEPALAGGMLLAAGVSPGYETVI
jgi:hypothetical protein